MIGDLDLPDRLALTHQLANQITGAHLAIIPGVAHMVHIEQPEEFTRLVLRFLSQEEERFSFFGQSTRGIGKTVLGAL
jgi:pimeloyl-ACP methyl ester carboxylesterase